MLPVEPSTAIRLIWVSTQLLGNRGENIESNRSLFGFAPEQSRRPLLRRLRKNTAQSALVGRQRPPRSDVRFAQSLPKSVGPFAEPRHCKGNPSPPKVRFDPRYFGADPAQHPSSGRTNPSAGLPTPRLSRSKAWRAHFNRKRNQGLNRAVGNGRRKQRRWETPGAVKASRRNRFVTIARRFTPRRRNRIVSLRFQGAGSAGGRSRRSATRVGWACFAVLLSLHRPSIPRQCATSETGG